MPTTVDHAKSYCIAIITCLAIERSAVIAVLDEAHTTPKDFIKNGSDSNVYAWGKIQQHNVVIASLPEGRYGTTAAAVTAQSLSSSLPHIRVGLLVGIAAGVPGQIFDPRTSKRRAIRDIRLGDVVVSTPDRTNGGVVQYDLRKAKDNGDVEYERKGMLKPPPDALLNALLALKASHELQISAAPELLTQALNKYPALRSRYSNPSQSAVPDQTSDGDSDQSDQAPIQDHFFSADYAHVGGTNCRLCDVKHAIKRKKRSDSQPRIHYGTIASGNTLLKSTHERDKLLDWLSKDGVDVLALEMEAAGLMNTFPCVVIRGICDYADSHKNDAWQRYAALTSACFAKEFLEYVEEQQMQLEQSIGDAVAGIQRTEDLVSSLDEKLNVSALPEAFGASFESREIHEEPECLPDTRTELLDQVYTWATHEEQPRIFWLSGKAGTGKSTISRTVARHFLDRDRFCGSFFFSRGKGDRSDATMFFSTLAKQVALANPFAQEKLATVLANEPGISRKAFKVQYDRLLCEPLAAANFDETPVIVIDALDECGSEQHIRAVLKLLAKDGNSSSIRVFVTSRPELPIRQEFSAMSMEVHLDLDLGQIPRAIIEADILQVLRHEFKLGRQQHDDLEDSWPSEDDLLLLTQRAVPSFIFATTTCRFVTDPRGDPVKRLKTVLHDKHLDAASQLDATYLPVFEQILLGLGPRERDSLSQEVNRLLGYIITVADPLSIVSLSNLTRTPKTRWRQILRHFHSVLHIPDDEDAPIRPLHASLRDFLVDPLKQNTRLWFSIDERAYHRLLGSLCLQLLTEKLHRNMCKLLSIGSRRTSVTSDHIHQHVTSDVQYACVYWLYHVRMADQSSDDNHEVLAFLRVHALHWIEALSFMRKLPVASTLLRDFNDALLNADLSPKSGDLHNQSPVVQDEDLSKVLEDLHNFIVRNIHVLDHSPLQVYSSALMFTARDRVTFKWFHHLLSAQFEISPAGLPQSDTVQRLEHEHGVTAIAFAPNGETMFTITRDLTLRIWNIKTCEEMQSFDLADTAASLVSPVHGLIFSPSGDWILLLGPRYSTNDCYSAVLDTATGSIVHEFADGISFAAFAPVGKTLAVSAKYHLCLYDFISRKQVTLPRKHTARISCLCFDHSGEMVVTGDVRGLVAGWDVDRRMLKATNEHASGIASMCCSKQSPLLIYAVEETLFLRNVKNGSLLGRINARCRIVDIALACDDATLLVASDFGAVRCYDLQAGTPMRDITFASGRACLIAINPKYRNFALSNRPRTDGSVVNIKDLPARHSSDYTHQCLKVSDDQSSVDLLFDPKDWNEVQKNFSRVPRYMRFSEDGLELLLCFSSPISDFELYDVRTKSLKQSHEFAMTWNYMFPGSSYFVFVTPNEVMIPRWQDAGKLDRRVMSLRHNGSSHSNITCLQGSPHDFDISPCGHVLAILGYERCTQLLLYDTATGEKLLSIDAGAEIDKLWFSEDAKLNARPVDGYRRLDHEDVLKFRDKLEFMPADHGNLWSKSLTSKAILAVKDNWITKSGENLLWLPSEERGLRNAAYGNMLAILNLNGTLSWYQVPEEDHPPEMS